MIHQEAATNFHGERVILRPPNCGLNLSGPCRAQSDANHGLLSTGENAGGRWHAVVCVDK
jgi:hypothetical protein